MAAIHWKYSDGGLFLDPQEWIGGVVPGAHDDAVLDAPGGEVAFVQAESATVRGIQIASDGLLFVKKGAFVASNGTDGGVNAGEIAVLDGRFTFGGVLTNTGIVSLQGGPNTNFLAIAGRGALSGGGHVNLLTNFAGNPNEIIAAAPGAVLINVDNTISGAGTIGIGGEALTLVNKAAGVIDATGANALVIYTGANTIANAGLIKATGKGGVAVKSALDNTGLLEANGGGLTVYGAVTGGGKGVINSGTLRFESSFSENVAFTGRSGSLHLSDSQNYTGTVSGFSKMSQTSLDLRDIGFVGAGEASFVGTASGGVLTVTDGVHTARIHLAGDYLGSTFMASSDGHGGTMVVDPRQTHSVQPAAAHFVSVMAAFDVRTSANHWSWSSPDVRLATLLTAPRS